MRITYGILKQALSIGCIALVLCVPNLSMALSDDAWLAYFGSEWKETRDYYVKMETPVGPLDFIRREKWKGTQMFEGTEYRAATIVFDSGPYANRNVHVFTRVSPDGLYERQKDGKERLLVPRPLEAGQTWTGNGTTYTFEGIEDFETFDKTIQNCARITVVEVGAEDPEKEPATTTKYYEKGKGLIYKSVTQGNFGFVSIWREYAAEDK